MRLGGGFTKYYKGAFCLQGTSGGHFESRVFPAAKAALKTMQLSQR
jgi:hypothetical protein